VRRVSVYDEVSVGSAARYPRFLTGTYTSRYSFDTGVIGYQSLPTRPLLPFT